MCSSYNSPIVIGRAAVMAGDVVLGLREGVVFIPAHLAQEVVESAEMIQLRDKFGFERLKAEIYTAGQIDSTWTEEITQDFHTWLQQVIETLPEAQQDMIRRRARS